MGIMDSATPNTVTSNKSAIMTQPAAIELQRIALSAPIYRNTLKSQESSTHLLQPVKRVMCAATLLNAVGQIRADFGSCPCMASSACASRHCSPQRRVICKLFPDVDEENSAGCPRQWRIVHCKLSPAVSVEQPAICSQSLVEGVLQTVPRR